MTSAKQAASAISVTREAERKQHHDDGRRQRESGPRGQRATVATTPHAQPHARLTARRPGQQLAQRNQVGITRFVEPASTNDEFVAEIAEVRDRPTKRGQTQPQKDQENPPDALRVVASGGGRRSNGQGLDGSVFAWVMEAAS
ncbi:MAG: hypothetical protein AMXMBFR6_08070 [Betaproteobacteria bacterium]